MSKNLLFSCFASLLLFVSCRPEPSEDYSIPVDGDGNTYQTITIGTQTWMVGNLQTTHLNDGTPIEQDVQWENAEVKPVFCYYDNNSANEATYGMLYNWHAVRSGKLAPKGWHVATKQDWEKLIAHYGGLNKAGGAFKALKLWREPNTGATNSSRLGLLPTGCCLGSFESGIFEGQGEYGYWWTSTPAIGGGGEMIHLSYNSETVEGNGSSPDFGYAVVCVKN
ncbi:MAG TPA: fibrobacter succinogenes major paralogous domain-containing protein [Paludibacteraceae bacterium]|nr:fibrobacter succinogenes major paralogous domain-containing protein [Paludibacteraceae bacterium]HRS67210.1 fibrobacter succinogenes major paralogous domain-containing protein [Paludibacteraceae bacterium]